MHDGLTGVIVRLAHKHDIGVPASAALLRLLSEDHGRIDGESWFTQFNATRR